MFQHLVHAVLTVVPY